MKGGFERNVCENYFNNNTSNSSRIPGECLGDQVVAYVVKKCCDDAHTRCVIDLVFSNIHTPLSLFFIKIPLRRLDMSPGEYRTCELVMSLSVRFARKYTGTEVFFPWQSPVLVTTPLFTLIQGVDLHRQGIRVPAISRPNRITGRHK